MRPRSTTVRFRWARTAAAGAASLALLTPTTPARAADAAPWSAIAPLEGRVDVAVTIDRAADQIESQPGQSLARFALESGMLDGTLEALDHLARTLGVSPAGVVDRLLSRRVTLLADFDPPRAAPLTVIPAARWAFVTEVDRDTERWVRSRLKAAPRDVLPGATVLAVEDGRFRMAVAEQPGGATHLVIAPADSADLFKLAVEFAAADEPPNARPKLPAGDIIGFARLDALYQGGSTVFWSSNLTDTGWHTALARRNQAPPATGPGLGAAAFSALAQGSVASVSAADPALFTRWLMGTAPIVQTLGVPDPASGALTMSLFANPDSPDAPFNASMVARLIDRPNARAQFDASVGSYLVPFVPDPAAGVESFEGRFPAAVRTQPITIRTTLLSRWLGTSAEVAWRYASDEHAAFATIACTPADSNAAADLARRSAHLIESTQTPGPPLAFGLILHPADLKRAIPAPPTGPAKAFRWVHELRLLLNQPAPGTPGVSRGEMVLTMNPVQDPQDNPTPNP